MTIEITKQEALDYHEFPSAGKLGIAVTKSTVTQRDLSLAYTPGVAEPVLAIAENQANVYRYTSKGNLVGILSNGTAILGLGNLGALASKPVMEGKAVLFKQFADVDAFDIEMDTTDVESFINAAIIIAPTFGAINLEDIKAPECFIIEEALKKSLDIPVMHDDQHGTAIVLAAGLLNALEIQNKTLSSVKIVIYGAGAAAIACGKLLIKLGMNRSDLLLLDSKGVLNHSRTDLNPYKQEMAINTEAQSFIEAMNGADVVVGLAGAAMPDPEQALKSMNSKPIIFLLSNPTPGMPLDLVRKTCPDAIVATGRSDYPNQINNALCFPYLFRGALDAQASAINTAMQIAAVDALRQLAKEPIPDVIKADYQLPDNCQFGPSYILPKPSDPRLKKAISSQVKQAAIESGVANITNLKRETNETTS